MFKQIEELAEDPKAFVFLLIDEVYCFFFLFVTDLWLNEFSETLNN